jgi:hypothetical protein
MLNFRDAPHLIALWALLAIAHETRSARAAVTGDDPYATEPPPLGFTVGLGFRSDLVRSPGLDAFSSTDGVPQSALSVWYRLAGVQGTALAMGFAWNHGGTTASARGAEALLTVDRLSLGLEARMTVSPRLSVFARMAPGLARDHASLLDDSAPGGAFGGRARGAMEQTSWVATADVSGGVAFRMGQIRAGASRMLGLWLTAEAGYSYSRGHDLVLSSRAEGQPGRTDEPVRLGRLALRGAFAGAGVAMSF